MMNQTKTKKPCSHCAGKGYLELRDCSGEIQREETCSWCGGTGEVEEKP
jgi:DnaJ-class molecular chaperone